MATQLMRGYVVLTGIAKREGGQFVSHCRELDVSSCGDTAEEALENLGDAIKVYIDALTETRELSRVFRERHIRIDPPPKDNEVTIRVSPGDLCRAYAQSVPVEVA